MNRITEVLKKYYNSFKSLKDKETILKIKEEWKTLDNEWFIKYLNFNLKENTIDLKEIDYIIDTLKLEMSLEIVKDIFFKCPDFLNFIEFNYGSIKTEEELEYLPGKNIIYSYLLLEEKLEDVLNKDDSLLSDSNNYYIKELKSIPILSFEETRNLFIKRDELRNLILKGIDILENEKKLKEVMKKILEGNLRLVIKPASKKSKDESNFLDLVEEGNIGLMKAAEKFDLSFGTKFSTYAMWYIRSEMNTYIYNNDRTIRVPKNIYEDYHKILNAKEKAQNELNRNPDLDEVAKKLDITMEELIDTLTTFENIESLDEDSPLEDGGSKYEYISDNYLFESDLLDKLYVEDIMEFLEPYRAKIIRLYFGIYDGVNKEYLYEHTFREIAHILNISETNVKIEISKSLEKIRIILRNNKSYQDLHRISPFLRHFSKEERKYVMDYFNSLPDCYKMSLQKRYGNDLDSVNKCGDKIIEDCLFAINIIKEKINNKKLNDDTKLVRSKKE